jgi:23S rRNA pseudouridine2605 synthase
VQTEGERLQKYLARAGIASRRHAEELIRAGAVSVNDIVITELGTRIDPDADSVRVNGSLIQPANTLYTVAIHKPAGYVATARDPQGRPIVADLLPENLRMQRLVPVGRLDLDTEGLLILSNDGNLALRLTHPRYETEKEYHALVDGPVNDDALQQLRHGVVLPGDDPRPTSPAIVWRLHNVYPRPATGQEWLGLIIHEGRKRQVRLMCGAVGTPTRRLIRARIGNLRLNDVVPESGSWKILGDNDITALTATSKSTRESYDH